ncbi:putative inner membrane protein [Yersinia enterocolitica]|uniref:Inner membrane protein n=1 Tax=Yersinia enterocolitica TaxID=630 RepID=A0A9P1M3Y8_YEREN|nr:MMPL family transporter [Yersinia enterocolitica]CNE85146.1 putative inner membrane protein [Yersinia enterocolitica]
MPNSSFLRTDCHRKLAIGWLLVCLLLLATLLWLIPRSQINSSVLALLPKQELAGVPAELTEGFNQRLDRQLVWLVSPENDTLAPVNWWLKQLQKMPALHQVSGEMTAQRQQEWGVFFFQHRNVLLDDATRLRLSHGGDAQAQWILGQTYSAFAGVSGKELKHDPLLLVRGSQLAQQQNSGILSLNKGWLVAKDSHGRQWYLIHGKLRASSYDMASARSTVDSLAELKQQLQQRWPGTEVLERGTIFYSNYASQQAESDISTIGLISVAGVFLLILLMFKSLLPLGLCLLSITIGALAGAVATLLIFGEVHVMTLVLSASIIGISADYTLYYLTDRMAHGGQTTPLASLTKLFPALSMALLTTVIAYLILLIAPFPGLQQLAVFASAGLTAACITVMCWYPILAKRLPVRPVPSLKLIHLWLKSWQCNRVLRLGLPILIIIFTIIGLATLQVNDDISELQAMPAEFQQQEQRIATLTGQHSDQKWFVVYGDNAEQALQRLEQFSPYLSQAKKAGWIENYRVLPLPSLLRQQQNIALLKQTTPTIIEKLQQAGMSVSLPESPAEGSSTVWVTPPQWLDSVVSEGWRLLWLSLPDGRTAMLLPVSGVTNPGALQQLAKSAQGVTWVDRKTEFNTLFSVYRAYLSWLLLIAVVVIAVVYCWRFGFSRGLYCVTPTILSLGMGLAVLSVTGHSLNLFSLLALILVLGIGINYTLFFTNPRGTPSTSMFAIFMAVFTTQLTFGMLVFSHTQAISSFGIVLSSGVFTAFLLAPLALPKPKGERPCSINGVGY